MLVIQLSEQKNVLHLHNILPNLTNHLLDYLAQSYTNLSNIIALFGLHSFLHILLVKFIENLIPLVLLKTILHEILLKICPQVLKRIYFFKLQAKVPFFVVNTNAKACYLLCYTFLADPSTNTVDKIANLFNYKCMCCFFRVISKSCYLNHIFGYGILNVYDLLIFVFYVNQQVMLFGRQMRVNFFLDGLKPIVVMLYFLYHLIGNVVDSFK